MIQADMLVTPDEVANRIIALEIANIVAPGNGTLLIFKVNRIPGCSFDDLVANCHSIIIYPHSWVSVRGILVLFT